MGWRQGTGNWKTERYLKYFYYVLKVVYIKNVYFDTINSLFFNIGTTLNTSHWRQ